MGRPNCSRSLAYWRVVSKMARHVATVDSAIAVVACCSARSTTRGGAGVARLHEHAVAVDLDAVERHRGERQRGVDAPSVGVAGDRGVAGHDERAEAVGARGALEPGDDGELVGGGAVEHVGLRAVEHPAAGAGSGRAVAGSPRAASCPSSASGQRAGARARRDVGEAERATRPPGRSGHELGERGQERRRGHHPAELLDDDADLEEAEARARRAPRRGRGRASRARRACSTGRRRRSPPS